MSRCHVRPIIEKVQGQLHNFSYEHKGDRERINRLVEDPARKRLTELCTEQLSLLAEIAELHRVLTDDTSVLSFIKELVSRVERLMIENLTWKLVAAALDEKLSVLAAIQKETMVEGMAETYRVRKAIEPFFDQLGVDPWWVEEYQERRYTRPHLRLVKE